MVKHILLFAPATQEEVGITTRLRRYERMLQRFGIETTCVDAADISVNVQAKTWIHMLDPHGVAWHWSQFGRGELHTLATWLRQCGFGFSVQVTRFPITLDAVEGMSDFLEAVFTEARVIFISAPKLAHQFTQRYFRHAHKVQLLAPGMDLQDFKLIKDNGVEADSIALKHHELQRRLQFARAGKRIVLYAGRIAKDRSLTVFVRVMEKLQKQFSGVRGMMVGPIEEIEAAKPLLQQLQDAHIAYIGAVDHLFMSDIFAQAEVVWDPTASFDVSASIYEAMWMKRPTLVSRQVICPHVLPSQTTFTYDTEDEALQVLQRIFDGTASQAEILQHATRFITKVDETAQLEMVSFLRRLSMETKRVDGKESVG
ncbi:glycosyltransferase [Sulfoacidibacillus thermotolerans]|uniref:glycosyltransferase n=1 Tax=Sulfoacidibacillus thermotolerans TaxID=1765684 RepID=UPI0011B1F174|nr:glycosyltransferase [Sulfoacidibacillus thermotolerans]